MNPSDSPGPCAHSDDVVSRADALNAALISAVRRQDTLLVRRLLAAGADPNLRPSQVSRQSLLHLAATRRRDSGILALLLAAGARPNARDARGDSALVAATRAGCSWAVRQLVAAGADPAADKRRRGSVSAPRAAHEQLAQHRSYHRAEVVRMLDKGQSPLSPTETTLLRKLMAAVEGGDPAAIRRLLHAGAPLQALCPKRLEAPLHRAVALGNVKVVRQLLRAGADVNQFSSYGRTPLMRAMGRELPFMVSALLQAGADVNLRDPKGFRALDYCSDSECRRLLLAHGALRGKSIDPSVE